MLELCQESPLQNHAILKFHYVPNQERECYLIYNLSNMRSINCFITVVQVLLRLTKKIIFFFLDGTIEVCKIQRQCRAFATNVAQNTVELYLKIQEEISFPQP